jgi:peptidoglycan/xylan/chitin deacetylase (PgdA/CDA1 family)
MITRHVDVRGPIADIEAAPAIDRVRVTVAWGPLVLDELVLPLCGRLSSRQLAHAICAHWNLASVFGRSRSRATLIRELRRRWAHTIRFAPGSPRRGRPRTVARQLWLDTARTLSAWSLSACGASVDGREPDRPRDAAALVDRCRTEAGAPLPARPPTPRGGSAAAPRRRSSPAQRVPILMYHRVTESPVPALRRWAVTPAGFERQLQFLAWLGCRSISSTDLRLAARECRPLPSRPVLFTFDDGYLDFAETAWPLLQQYGFSAEVYVVTGSVGGTADWDAEAGPPAPLMAWPDIERLGREGVSFGSHLTAHVPAATLSTEAVIRAGARSRFDLERWTTAPVVSISLPYGSYDSRVATALRWCGYEIAFTTVPALAGTSMNPMALPRIEIERDDDLVRFADKLGYRRELRAWLGTAEDGRLTPERRPAVEVRS